MYIMTRERWDELSLGIYKEDCESCEYCYEKDGHFCCDCMSNITIDEAIGKDYECPCLDEERLEEEMSEEEYDAFRHNRIVIKG